MSELSRGLAHYRALGIRHADRGGGRPRRRPT
jgi:hypothetical protein